MPLNRLRKTQSAVSKELERDLSLSSLPSSLLFYGPRGSSRLTGALDLAYEVLSLSGREGLENPNGIVYLPERDGTLEFEAALSLFKRTRTKRSRVFVLESARKYLLQYDRALSGIYSQAVNQLFERARELSSLLMDFEEESDEKREEKLLSEIEKIVSSGIFRKGKKSSTLQIDEIRSLSYSLSLGNTGFLILEGVENAQEGVKNSLLKLLEEPPENSRIVLISQNPQRLLETILSRVRKYSFRPLGKSDVKSLLESEYGVYEEYSSMEEFFIRENMTSEELAIFEMRSKVLSNALINRRELSLEERENLYDIASRFSLEYLLSLTLSEIEKSALLKRCDYKDALRAYRSIKEWSLKFSEYNLSDRAALDLILREAK